MSEQHVHDIAEMLDGTVESMERLPDFLTSYRLAIPAPAGCRIIITE